MIKAFLSDTKDAGSNLGRNPLGCSSVDWVLTQVNAGSSGQTLLELPWSQQLFRLKYPQRVRYATPVVTSISQYICATYMLWDILARRLGAQHLISDIRTDYRFLPLVVSEGHTVFYDRVLVGGTGFMTGLSIIFRVTKTFSGRRCYSVGGLLQSLCLSVCRVVYCG